LKNKTKLLIGNIVVILLLSIGIVSSTSTGLQQVDVQVELLYNAGVMIESGNTRIYIDPFDLPSNYSNYPADAILITHGHGDHYDPTSIDIIATDDTSFYFPANMSAEALLYDATSVEPEDTFTVNNIDVRCFYMYTMPGEPESSHPQSSNYTSYIVDIDGFTIFHAGDSWNIDEYTQLNGEIDLVLLPLGPGCQTMTGTDVVSVITTINPNYFIPIHFSVEGKESFMLLYFNQVENSGCDILDLDYYDSYDFSQSDTTTTTTTTDNESSTPGFSLIVAIFTVTFLLIGREKRKKNI
jgi:L-ascorbate metabolism protein UlaG (beta-lactamase superfamily)